MKKIIILLLFTIILSTGLFAAVLAPSGKYVVITDLSYDLGVKGGSYTTTLLSEGDAKLVIRGFTVGIGGSFAF